MDGPRTDVADIANVATSASQTTVWALPPHEPLGTTQTQQDPDQDSIATDIPLRFARQIFDADTGPALRLAWIEVPSVFGSVVTL